MARARAGFIEMPGLTLTPQQGAKLFGVDPDTAAVALELLWREGFLQLTRRGYYVRS